MLSIIIVYCDKDKDNLSNLLNQIKERVSVEHEVITVSNCSKKDNKATFSFGYNAYQFEARKKGLELAKGDFVWFVDGDDEVIGLDKIEDVDIAVYNYNSKTTRNHKEKNYDSTSLDDYYYCDVQLWNKIYRKSLFDNFNFSGKIVSSEDVIFSLFAWKKAKKIKSFDKEIYKQNIGYSNKESISEVAIIENMFTGGKDSLSIISSIVTKQEFELIKLNMFCFYSNLLSKAESEYVIKEIMDNLILLFGMEYIKEKLKTRIIHLKKKTFVSYLEINYDFNGDFFIFVFKVGE